MEERLEVLPRIKLEHTGTIQLSMRKNFPTIAANKNNKKMTTKTASVEVTAVLSRLWFKQM